MLYKVAYFKYQMFSRIFGRSFIHPRITLVDSQSNTINVNLNVLKSLTIHNCSNKRQYFLLERVFYANGYPLANEPNKFSAKALQNT